MLTSVPLGIDLAAKGTQTNIVIDEHSQGHFLKLYSKFHQWLKVEADQTARMGICQALCASSRPITSIELPPTDKMIFIGNTVGRLVSLNASFALYAMVSGRVLQTNPLLIDSLNLLNEDPEGDAWLFKMQLSEPSESELLLTENDYYRYLREI
jgi:glycine cleavage system H protein